MGTSESVATRKLMKRRLIGSVKYIAWKNSRDGDRS